MEDQMNFSQTDFYKIAKQINKLLEEVGDDVTSGEENKIAGDNGIEELGGDIAAVIKKLTPEERDIVNQALDILKKYAEDDVTDDDNDDSDAALASDDPADATPDPTAESIEERRKARKAKLMKKAGKKDKDEEEKK